MTKKTWIIFAVMCLALIGGLVYLSTKNRVDVSNVDDSKIISASTQNGNIPDRPFGNTKSKIVLFEYGDYQCPGCESVYPTLKQISEKYEDQIAFVYRNLPLPSIHPNAMAAAAAAESAGLQGKFWEMHDLLFEQQAAWRDLAADRRTAQFEEFATQLGLNLEKFRTDMTSSAVQQKINFDRALAQKEGYTGTPTLTLNGEVVEKYIKDGKVVDKGTKDASPIWSDMGMFEQEVIEPALKNAGIALPKE